MGIKQILSGSKAATPAPSAPSPQPSSEDLDAVVAEQETKEATTTAPAPVPNTPGQAALAKVNQKRNQQAAKESDSIDSIGSPKAPLQGPRGTNAPRDAKVAPQKKADQTKITVTDQRDSAGEEKPGHGVSGHPSEHHIGIRGQHTSRDTYKL